MDQKERLTGNNFVVVKKEQEQLDRVEKLLAEQESHTILSLETTVFDGQFRSANFLLVGLNGGGGIKDLRKILEEGGVVVYRSSNDPVSTVPTED